MVSKITIFEPHFDGAQFGPASIDGSDEDMDSSGETAAVAATEESSGRSVPGRKLLAGAVLASLALGMVALRRFRKGDDPAEDAPAPSADEVRLEEATVE